MNYTNHAKLTQLVYAELLLWTRGKPVESKGTLCLHCYRLFEGKIKNAPTEAVANPFQGWYKLQKLGRTTVYHD